MWGRQAHLSYRTPSLAPPPLSNPTSLALPHPLHPHFSTPSLPPLLLSGHGLSAQPAATHCAPRPQARQPDDQREPQRRLGAAIPRLGSHQGGRQGRPDISSPPSASPLANPPSNSLLPGFPPPATSSPPSSSASAAGSPACPPPPSYPPPPPSLSFLLQVADFGLSKPMVQVDKHNSVDLNQTYKMTGETGSYR